MTEAGVNLTSLNSAYLRGGNTCLIGKPFLRITIFKTNLPEPITKGNNSLLIPIVFACSHFTKGLYTSL